MKAETVWNELPTMAQKFIDMALKEPERFHFSIDVIDSSVAVSEPGRAFIYKRESPEGDMSRKLIFSYDHNDYTGFVTKTNSNFYMLTKNDDFEISELEWDWFKEAFNEFLEY